MQHIVEQVCESCHCQSVPLRHGWWSLAIIPAGRVIVQSDEARGIAEHRGVTFETDTFAKLMGERNDLRVGFHVGREQWNPAAIPTILTVRQRQPATTTNRRYMLANGAVFASGPSARLGPSIIAGEATREGISFCADGV